MMPRLLQVDDVGKSFRNVRAVDSVSFDVLTGEIFALLGPNGAGKSTLVRMMIGMLPPDQGVIRWFDNHGNPCAIDRSQIGYLPEDRGLYRDQKVLHILTYFGALRGMSHRAAKQAANQWAERLEVSQYLNSKLETLSKGNQQKVQVAASVLHEPRLALLDEPFSGLDPLNQEMMLGIIRSLRDQGTTVLLSAHQLELVERLADRVFLLSHGKQVLEGTVAQLKVGDYSGYALRIGFNQCVPIERFDEWRSSPNILGIEAIDARWVEFTLRDASSATECLERASQIATISEFRGGSLSLHEIYLRALRKSPSVVAP
jgi:ABC-2 type transport system ATP-binding protein